MQLVAAPVTVPGSPDRCRPSGKAARYVERLALNDEPGGEGEHRGGKGIVLEYRVRSNGCFFTCAYTRNRHPPWSLQGGCEGSPNYAEVLRAGGTVETYAVITALEQGEAAEFTWPTAQEFFNTIRTHTMEGMFADPIYGGNKDFAGWRLVGFPGAQPIFTRTDMESRQAFKRVPITGL